ncbi:hypothetical protein ACLETS_04695 [Enterobacter ludwigii]|uniref:hypothetical protein n=1 Tax=Enterobacter ludwigii TaxID=299767 RepID=UPI0039760013
MDTLRCYWDVFFNAYGSLLTKTVLVLLLVWWWCQTLQRFRKEAPDATGPIAEANARERYQWRYLRWALSSIQGILSLYIIGLIITTLFT